MKIREKYYDIETRLTAICREYNCILGSDKYASALEGKPWSEQDAVNNLLIKLMLSKS